MKKNLVRVIGLAAVLATCSAWAVVVETTNVVVSSESTLGIRRTICDETTPSELAIGVPWLDFSTNSITIADLLFTGVDADDTLMAFDHTNKTYWVWTWDAESCAWKTTRDITTGVRSPNPATFRVDRGTGLWLERAHPTNTFWQAGLYTTIPATNQVNNVNSQGKTGSVTAPAYTLLFSPNTNIFNLASLKLADGCMNNDRVYVPSTMLNCSFRKSKNSWGVFKGSTWTQTNSIPIPSNTAFWYLSAGGNPKFVW